MKLFVTLILLGYSILGFSQTEVSYRHLQSAVKNQAQRGTCTAFGLCAAFEIMPGVPSNLSEQYLYARIKYDNFIITKDTLRLYKEGEFLKNYIFTITAHGLISEERMPYNRTAPMATNDKDLFEQYLDITRTVSLEQMEDFQKESYRLTSNQYTYLDINEVKNIETIKEALRSGIKAIPVCYNMHSAQWSNIMLPYMLQPQIDLDGNMYVEHNGKFRNISDVKKDVPTIEEKIINEEVKTYPKFKNEKTNLPSYTDGGHCVTIVGYNQYGFIIKNSWGKNWGDGGYATISYNFHRVFATEALILKSFDNVKLSVASPFDILKGDQIRLKTLPTLINLQKGLSFSFFYEGPKIFPAFEKIEIKFFKKLNLAASKGEYIGNCFADINETNYNKGYLVNIPNALVQRIISGEELVTEVDFVYNVGTRKITNTYGTLEWKNKMYSNTPLGAYIDRDEE